VGADEVSTGVYDRRFAEALDIAEADVDGDGVVEMWEADRWGNGLIWMLKSGVAFRSDFDKDGLSDILENNTAFWNSIGVFGDDLPYWKIPDLYVELDWMKGFKPDIFGTFTAHLPWATALYLTLFTTAAVYFLVAILCFLGVITAPLGVIGLIIALVAMVAGFVVYHATEEVINIKDIFKDHNINLHIDDGCMGGGEGNIPYSPSIDDDEIYQSNSTYFDPRRMGKFYYGVFCDEIPGLIYGKGWGDSFLIAKGEIGSQKSLASHFIHELGHCIIEEIDNGSDADHPDHRSEGWFDDYKWTHCDNDCAMYYTGDTYRHGFLLTGRPVDYCSDCWHELERDGIGGGSV